METDAQPGTSELAVLGGRVIRRRLACFEGRPGAEAPRLKRLKLAQGELAHFHDGDEPASYLAWLEFRAGRVRGNHYHERKRERFYLAAGALRVWVEDVRTGERAELEMQAGDLVVLPPGIAHAMHPLSEGHGVEFAAERVDLSDSFPYRIAGAEPGVEPGRPVS